MEDKNIRKLSVNFTFCIFSVVSQFRIKEYITIIIIIFKNPQYYCNQMNLRPC